MGNRAVAESLRGYDDAWILRLTYTEENCMMKQRC